MAKIKSFSHLFGRGAKASDEPDDEKDEEARKAKKAEEEEEARKAKKAEENNDDPDDSDDKDPDASDDGDDNDGDDSDESNDAKKGRNAERNRCARIFGSKHAAGRGELAVSLALNSGMSSAAVIRVLASTSAVVPPASASRKRSLDERMQANGNAQPGQDAAVASKGASMVTKMTSLYDSARGKK
ncbi:hypothetical protein [Yersinia pekkanenii]|uniref:Uncharacterized protein n=1 Tax=Yersinia pekkanenii TaxID=1288385 RepID=A0A0T9RPD4_9GAMM|nr:hypothetical protein [Yersinia pekkanenii]CNI75270.1 Uncharacterised protein [Yersinia pekkanenii]CRY66247.1 Uncharacterised protein [Yersinia pekkanenii]